jgi:mono/diheme cytochrome c family protein
MTRLPKSITIIAAALAVSVSVAACGEQKIEVAADSPQRHAAEVFKQRCAGCHTFRAAGTRGSAANIRTRERTDGPNFNVRHECVQRVLYAIQNGGFSGAVMPGNIVVGRDAVEVAEFVSRYAGQGAGSRPEGMGDAANGYQCTSEQPEPSDTSENDPQQSGSADSGTGPAE